jgi:predicted RNA-binding Zn ribbon-like protein
MPTSMTAKTGNEARTDAMATTKDLRRAGFPFRSGTLCLDFVATLAKRDRGERELLGTPDQLLMWCQAANLPAPRGRLAASDVDRARALREAVYRLARARVDRDTPAADDLRLVNDAAQAGPPTPTLGLDGITAVLPNGAPLAAILSLVARDAIGLFSGPYALRIRECVAEDCSLFFVDRSRPGSRRWCAMAACGEKASSTTYRQRHPAHGSGLGLSAGVGGTG